MMKFIILFLFLSSALYAQPLVKWQHCYGGTKSDLPGGILPTRDGGYIMTGSCKSADGDLTFNHGGYDLWVVKMKSDGTLQWQKSYGGSLDDQGGSVLELPNGYLIGGITYSSDGDLTGAGHHGSSKTADIWILKIDTAGSIIWQKTFGGSSDDWITGLAQVGEGVYFCCGNTNSSDGDVKGFYGSTDIWVFSFTESGTILWQKNFGGAQDDEADALERTHDGGFLISGYTSSTDHDLLATKRDSSYDVWNLKITAQGKLLWQKSYGGSGYDAGNDAIETLDGGMISAGITFSGDGDVHGLHGVYYSDAWIFKTDSGGNIQWQKCLGGSFGDAAFNILQNPDSTYLVAASTSSEDGDVTNFLGVSDCWIVKLSKKGDILWEKAFGGSFADANLGSGILPAADSGFLIITETESTGGDIKGKHGDSTDWDIWLFKISDEKSAVQNSSLPRNEYGTVYPNPSSGFATIRCSVETPGDLTIELFNLFGEKLRTLFDSKVEAGEYRQQFDLSGMASGQYYIRLCSNRTWQTSTITLIR